MDSALRNAQRQGDDTLLYRLRAGRVELDNVRLLAYVGDVEAAEALPRKSCRYCRSLGWRWEVEDDDNACGCSWPDARPPCWNCENAPEDGWPQIKRPCPFCLEVETAKLSPWITALEHLAVGDRTCSVPCESCEGDGYKTWARGDGPPGRSTYRCRRCHGTGKRQVTVPLRKWLSARITCDAAREAFVPWELGLCTGLYLHECQDARKALNALAAWLSCPCNRHESACDALVPKDSTGMAYAPTDGEFWVRALLIVTHTSGHIEAAAHACAQILGEPRVRELTKQSVLKAMGRE